MTESGKALIECEGMVKRYSGYTLGPLSLSLRAGETLGLVGRNGAGKSTLLRSILRLIQLDEGNLKFSSELEGGRHEQRNAIGYISDRPIFYDWMTVNRTIGFCSQFYKNWNLARQNELCDYLGIDRGKKVGDLSTGNRLKLALLLCLCQGAKVLLLDEPTSGLDPIVREDLLALIRESVEREWVMATVFASHVLSEVASIATRVVILQAGIIVDEFGMRDLAADDEIGVSGSLTERFSERCLEAMR
jgi:ABC-2 type transport system ATP-binding protein